MKEELQKLGFSISEAEVYLALIDIGKTGAGEIIKRTSLHRNIVYETLDKLIAKKLVSKFVFKKVAQFIATDPNRILEEQKNRLEIASEIVPGLISKSKFKQEIVIYEGLDGFKTFNMHFIESTKENTVLHVLGAVGDRWYELMGDKYKKYEKLRASKKIWFKMVEYHESAIDKQIMDRNNYYDVRVVQQNFETPANVLIWNDYIALQTLVEPYSVIEIKNPALAKSYLNYFNLLWKSGKPIGGELTK
ncbi:MAG: helix-turn-helix domain-containing protein [Candidatus Berkelbacteria bacterium]